MFLSIGSWRDTYQFFKCLCKIVLRRKSAGLGDLCDGVIGVTQQSFAVGDPQLQQVVDRRDGEGSRKLMGEVVFIPVDDGCDPLECYRFVEVLFDVGFGALTFIRDIGWRRKGKFFPGDPVELQQQDGQVMLADFLIGSLFFFAVLPGSCAGVRGSSPGGRRAGRSGRGRRFLLRGSKTGGYRFQAQYSAFFFLVRSVRYGGLWG